MARRSRAATPFSGASQHPEMLKDANSHQPGGIGIFAAEEEDVDADSAGKNGQYAKHAGESGIAGLRSGRPDRDDFNGRIGIP